MHLAPELKSNPQFVYVGRELRSWLRHQALENTPYDEFVRRLLRVPLVARGNGATVYYSTDIDPKPTFYYVAKETDAANLASSTARVFLGIRVDCAQCHDHPFSSWKQDDFWGYAAFFQDLQRPANPLEKLRDSFFVGSASAELSIEIPESDRTVKATFLDGQSPAVKGLSPRGVVADWLVGANNPYFSRAMVNRTWGQLLGRGIVEPVDDMDAANPPSHPELLDAMAEEFAKDFDVPSLIEGIVLSLPYQRSSRADNAMQDPELFARFLPRRLESNASVRQFGRGACSSQTTIHAIESIQCHGSAVRRGIPELRLAARPAFVGTADATVDERADDAPGHKSHVEDCSGLDPAAWVGMGRAG